MDGEDGRKVSRREKTASELSSKQEGISNDETHKQRKTTSVYGSMPERRPRDRAYGIEQKGGQNVRGGYSKGTD